MAAVKLVGKTIVTTMASDATAYTVGYLSNQAGAPLAITMLLSMGSGIAVTKVAGKYFFKNAAGELLGECNVPGENLDGLKGSLKSELSEADRIKIDKWKYRPDDDLYIKNKKVFDNPKYYDQLTGNIHWPPDDGFLEGTKNKVAVDPTKIFKRIGNPSGEFLGNATDSFEARALAPSSQNAPEFYYRPTEKFEMTVGKVAPWFDSGGGAEQFVKYHSDGSKYTIQELLNADLLEDVTDLVKKGEVKIE